MMGVVDNLHLGVGPVYPLHSVRGRERRGPLGVPRRDGNEPLPRCPRCLDHREFGDTGRSEYPDPQRPPHRFLSISGLSSPTGLFVHEFTVDPGRTPRDGADGGDTVVGMVMDGFALVR